MQRPFADAVDGALQGTAKPYGFTITIWAGGAALISQLGTPNTGQAFLFAAGVVAAYGLLRVATATRQFEGEQPQLSSRKEHLLGAGAFHVAGIGTGVGAAALAGLLDTGAAWPLGAFAATLAYLLVTSLEFMR